MNQQPVKQAFGSPGGKSYLAPRIVDMIPPHRTYVEPFAGGAAVFFRKARSEKEVLNDKDSEIAFAFRFLRDMTPEQYERLKRCDWRVSRGLFKKLKESNPKDDVERFRRFYYLKKGSFRYAGGAVNTGGIGRRISVDRLWKAKERLKNSRVYTGDAVRLVKSHDSPSAFFYLDPPYPGRAHVGATGRGNADNYGDADLMRLLAALRSMRGRYMLSLNKEYASEMPKGAMVRRVLVHRKLWSSGPNPRKLPNEMEIIASNYDTNKVERERRKHTRLVHTRPVHTRPVRIRRNGRKPRRAVAGVAGVRG